MTACIIRIPTQYSLSLSGDGINTATTENRYLATYLGMCQLTLRATRTLKTFGRGRGSIASGPPRLVLVI